MNPAFVLTGSEIKNGGGYKITAGVATGGADSITFTHNGEQIAEVGDGNHVIASSVSSTPNPLQENDLLVVHATWGDQKDEELRWRVGEGTVENMEDAEIIANNTIN